MGFYALDSGSRAACDSSSRCTSSGCAGIGADKAVVEGSWGTSASPSAVGTCDMRWSHCPHVLSELTLPSVLCKTLQRETRVTATIMAPDEGDATPYSFPEVHAFAPFYTLQPNAQTMALQVDLWMRLILSYCAAHRRFQLDVDGEWERTSDLFCHRELDRALSPDTIRLIFAYMVDKGRAIYDPPLPRGYKAPKVGQVEPDRRTHALSVSAARALPTYHIEPGNRIWVYWHTPSEWGDQIYAWVKDTGQTRVVLTLYELQHSVWVERQGLPPHMLRQALDTLVVRKCAQIFGSSATEGDDNLGIKFV